MSREQRKLNYHIFVCLHERVEGHPRGCCKAKNSEAVLKEFKKQVRKFDLNVGIRAQKSGCLDRCEDGVSAVMYPKGIWFRNLTPEDVPQIIEAHVCSDQSSM